MLMLFIIHPTITIKLNIKMGINRTIATPLGTLKKPISDLLKNIMAEMFFLLFCPKSPGCLPHFMFAKTMRLSAQTGGNTQ